MRTARRNEKSCQELTDRAQQVAEILPSSKAVARRDAVATSILRRLKGALDDALKLVESCGRRRSGCLSWPLVLVTSGGLADKFADVNGRINNCILDLQAANGSRTEKKINRQAANGARIEEKLDRLAAGACDHRRANNPREANAINTHNNGNGNSGWNKRGGQQNGGKGGNRKRGKKAAGPLPPPQFRPHAGAGVPFCRVHHNHSMEEDPTSCSVM